MPEEGCLYPCSWYASLVKLLLDIHHHGTHPINGIYDSCAACSVITVPGYHLLEPACVPLASSACLTYGHLGTTICFGHHNCL